MSADLEATRRQLKIKSAVTKRLVKENTMYRKELEDAKVKLEKLRGEGAEGWDVNNATKLLEESRKMVKDSSERMGKAVGELRDLVVHVRKNPEMTQDEEYIRAEEALEEACI